MQDISGLEERYMDVMNIAVNNYNFQWAFPEIAADELGLFSEQGIELKWHDATPWRVVDKSAMYSDLLESGTTDVYHAGEWACILRVLKSTGAWIVSQSLPGDGTLNSTFSLYVRRDAGYRSPADLEGKPIAIEVGTGSYYTVFQDLERFVPREKIKLVQVGEPHKRLQSLMEGRVEAASLLNPWSDLAAAAGFVELLRTSRSNPTVIVVRKDEDAGVLRRFFETVNGCIDRMNSDPSSFRALYFRMVEKTFGDMTPELREVGLGVRGTLGVPRWNRWVAYTKERFNTTYTWMVERGLAPGGKRADGLVAENAGEIFS